MQICSRLSDTTLGDVLGAMHRAKVTGQIRLTETPAGGARRVHAIYLSQGDVVSVDCQVNAPLLGDILRQRGLIDGPTHRQLGLKLADGKRRVGDLLIEDYHVSRDVVSAALRQQLRARLDSLFRLPDAVLSFHVACALPRASVPPLHTREYLHGRPRARDRLPPAARRGASGAMPATKSMTAARSAALAALGLEQDATTADVSRAFRALAQRLHPDRYVGAEESERRRAEQRFCILSAAYHTLVG